MKEELIGKKVKIIHANKDCIGYVIDETKNMIILITKNGSKKFIKNTIKIIINEKIVKGSKIRKRPEDRIKAC